MKNFAKEYLPFAGAGLAIGFSLGVLLFTWTYATTA